MAPKRTIGDGLIVILVPLCSLYTIFRLRCHPQLLDSLIKSQQRRMDRSLHRPHRLSSDDARPFLWGIRSKFSKAATKSNLVEDFLVLGIDY